MTYIYNVNNKYIRVIKKPIRNLRIFFVEYRHLFHFNRNNKNAFLDSKCLLQFSESTPFHLGSIHNVRLTPLGFASHNLSKLSLTWKVSGLSNIDTYFTVSFWQQNIPESKVIFHFMMKYKCTCTNKILFVCEN